MNADEFDRLYEQLNAPLTAADHMRWAVAKAAAFSRPEYIELEAALAQPGCWCEDEYGFKHLTCKGEGVVAMLGRLE